MRKHLLECNRYYFIPYYRYLSEAFTYFFYVSCSPEDWTNLYTTNVVGPFLMTTAFLPLLQKSTELHHGWSGTVINITSVDGLKRTSKGHFNYVVSKGALIHLNKLLSTEIAKAGLKIRVNNIAPGLFPSEMTTEGSKDNQKSEIPKEHKEELPSGRPGHDRDMAAAVLFCAGCQYLNGQTIPVDGGILVQVGM
jgi:NAD(P)-dependent dehydrogenase (short-subunit alcohol dehydrogenase family)